MEREEEREEGIHRGWEVGEQERRKEGKKKGACCKAYTVSSHLYINLHIHLCACMWV